MLVLMEIVFEQYEFPDFSSKHKILWVKLEQDTVCTSWVLKSTEISDEGNPLPFCSHSLESELNEFLK